LNIEYLKTVDNMKFGVFIRSIGERTESLCIDSCRQHVDSKNIHILRNYFPSYNVYREMFNRAEKSDYDWFLAVDADVVLSPNWYDMVMEIIKSVDSKTTFKFEFRVYDPIYDDLIYRGNHVYNNSFTTLAINALKKNILISRLPRFVKNCFKKGYYLKPETSLRGVLKVKHGLSNFSCPDVIGVHGAEQFFEEIFRTFLVRSKRNPEWVKKYDFLNENRRKQLLDENRCNRYVANLGWNSNKFDVDTIDARQQIEYKQILAKYNIKEHQKFSMNLESFYRKYEGKYENNTKIRMV